MEENIKEEKKEINVMPLGVGKRILCFLGDFFLNFVLAYILFNVMVLPLGRLMTSYTNRKEITETNLSIRSDIFKQNKIMFFNGEVDKTDVLYNTSFTFYCFFSYYVYDEESPSNAKYTQYGHKVENEVFHHYFFDIANNRDKYYEYFDKYNAKSGYFLKNDNIYTLKDDVKTKIFPCFDKSDVISQDGDKLIGQMENNFFYPMFSEMMTMIEKVTDLTYNGYSYNKLQSEIRGFEQYQKNLAIGCAFITLLISTGILYVMVPLLNKRKKTLTMMIMKIERVNADDLNLVKPAKIIINAIYAYLYSFVIAFFIPATFLTIYGIFSVSILMIFGIFSILLSITSLIFLFINSFNMDLFDYLTRSVMLTSDTLDEIYRAKGYYI